jgi:hypothetical protein
MFGVYPGARLGSRPDVSDMLAEPLFLVAFGLGEFENLVPRGLCVSQWNVDPFAIIPTTIEGIMAIIAAVNNDVVLVASFPALRATEDVAGLASPSFAPTPIIVWGHPGKKPYGCCAACDFELA